MMTEKILVRPMNQFGVAQRTSDGFFNATTLLKQWNESNPDKEARQLVNFWSATHLSELMAEIAKNEYGFNSLDFNDLKKLLSDTRRGKYNGGTWLHPILFIKFAMYINPSFEYHVIRFVYDEMIKFRILASDGYIRLTKAIKERYGNDKLPIRISYVSKAINYIVFNNHYKGIRDDFADEQHQKELFDYENKLADLIEEGFIPKYENLQSYLKNQWNKKYRPQLFSK